jgi:hypothetical protein
MKFIKCDYLRLFFIVTLIFQNTLILTKYQFINFKSLTSNRVKKERYTYHIFSKIQSILSSEKIIKFLTKNKTEFSNDRLVDVKVIKHKENLSNNKKIGIQWTSELTFISSNTWIGLYQYGQKVTQSSMSSKNKIKVKHTSGKGYLELPNESGIYQFRYIQDNNLHTIAYSEPIVINPPENLIFIKTNKSIVNLNEKLAISWYINKDLFILIQNQLKSEKIKINLCLNLLGNYDECLWSKLLTDVNQTNEGNLEIQMPDYAGYFVFRIILKSQNNPKTFTLSISDNIIHVTDFKFNFLFLSQTFVTGSSIETEWIVVKESQKGDWIGLYSIENCELFAQSSLRPVAELKTRGENLGKFKAILPPNTDSGQYFFVYFQKHVPVAVSEIVNLKQPEVKCPNPEKFSEIEKLIKKSFYKIDKRKVSNETISYTKSKIKNLIIIVTENHSFDAYFGNYCKKKPGSNPTCTQGPNCCEQPPTKVSGFKPVKLTDKQNKKWDPNHNQDCELCEINQGKMDGFVKNCFCSNHQNFAVSDIKTVKILHEFAKEYSLADRYFTPSAGASSQNDMYFARAKYVFKDNVRIGSGSVGSLCSYKNRMPSHLTLYYDPTITSLLSKCGRSLKTYAEGYKIAKMGQERCYPHGFDSSDIPYQFYAGLMDHPDFISDFEKFKIDLEGHRLPDVSFIKPLGIRSGHPGNKISSELKFVKKIVDKINNSEKYREETFIINRSTNF